MPAPRKQIPASVRAWIFNRAAILDQGMFLAALGSVYVLILVDAATTDGRALLTAAITLAFLLTAGLVLTGFLPTIRLFRDCQAQLLQVGDEVLCRRWSTTAGSPATLIATVVNIGRASRLVSERGAAWPWHSRLSIANPQAARVAIAGLTYQIPMEFLKITHPIQTGEPAARV